MFHSFLFIAPLCLIVIYAWFVVSIYRDWKHVRPFQRSSIIHPGIKVSVIIPFRNEEKNIRETLLNVVGFNSSDVEILAVNDHSTDSSAAIIESLVSEYPHLKCLSLSNTLGKKAALQFGVENSSGELIVTLDADVRVSPDWLQTILQFRQQTNASMIVMPVMFEHEKSLFHRMQTIEFASLMGTTAALVERAVPVMCNGANLAFTREAYERVKGQTGHENLSSGDDMFLLHKLKRENSEQIKYLLNREVIGWTKPCETVSEFVSQRARWASKAPAYRDSDAIVVASLIWLTNASIVFSFIAALAGKVLPIQLAILVLVKMSVDYILIQSVMKWFGKKLSFVLFVITALIYPLYSTLIPILGFFYRPKWKGRKISIRR